MQNKHQEHPEDTILTGDLSVLDWFVTPGALSVKIDGAPAIVWGIDPACGEFFVGSFLPVFIEQDDQMDVAVLHQFEQRLVDEHAAAVDGRAHGVGREE